MTTPEIARRCTSCGVSIRVRAAFCPQCGKPLKNPDMPDAARDDALAPTTKLPDLSEANAKLGADEQLTQKLSAPPGITKTPNSLPRKQPMQATIGMVQAEAPAPVPRPRVVIADEGRNRVEKFRQISSAMIDEAAYDPSLRFVLVAAALFIVFLFLLLLSELIT